MNLVNHLNWRYAVKKYSNRKLEAEKIEQILEATRLSASSVGIQSYRIFKITDEGTKRKLVEGGYDFNPQIVEAPCLLVFAAFEDITQAHINNYIKLIAKERQIGEDDLHDFKTKMQSYLLSRTPEENFTWSSKQAYIGLGTALIASAELQVDSTPMEGFNPEVFDEILQLKKYGLKSVVLLALGYRDENDHFASMKKVRLPLNEFSKTVVISE